MIEIDDLSKVYADRKVVDTVSMTIKTDSITTIVGTSGSGKTTLLRMINRLVVPSSGEVRIKGKPTSDIPTHILRRRIGYVIQGYGLFPHYNVARNIGAVPRLLGWDRDKINARVDELLTLFDLPPDQFRDRFPHQLSGGQQQRVGVARALASRPDLMLMDEPFGALDPIIRQRAQDDLKTIQTKLGATILLVTHDMNEAIRLGDMIAVMDQGRLIQYAPPAEIIRYPATPFVAAMVGAQERPMRLLSLTRIADLVQDGPASGDPLSVEDNLQDALSASLSSGREALPVERDGKIIGRITLDQIRHHAGPA